MTTIYLETNIRASAQTCFDLSRNIDLHTSSMAGTKEKAIGGKMSSLISEGESVMWEATHFWVRQKLTTRIREMVEPHYFIDEMTEGAFKSMWHKHEFIESNNLTTLIDVFKYEVPFGLAGRLFDWLILKRYMKNLLIKRNESIRRTAESIL